VSRAEDLSEIIARCTADDPDERYPTCEALAADLDNYLHGRPIAAKRNPTSWYRLKRVAALVMREHALPVRCALVVLVALVLTLLFHSLGGRTAQPLNPGAMTRMVGLGPATRDAIRDGVFEAALPGLSLSEPKSWRLLYGLFLERLAAARPLAVAFDVYFPECRPEYDEAFIRGLRAVRAPVVLAASSYNDDAEPEVCAVLRAAVHSIGSIKGVTPDYLKTEYEVVYAVERGFNPPIPSLAVSTYAAARVPDRTPRIVLDPTHQRLELRYERRASGGTGARFLPQTDQFPLHQLVRSPTDTEVARAGDMVAHARVEARPKAFWDERTIEMLDVLRASPEQVRGWFDNRVVLVGQMLPNKDQHRNGLGETIHGVQVHAEAIDALMWGARRLRFTRPELAARALFWCGLAGLGASFVSWAPRRQRAVWTFLSLLGLLAGPWLVGGSAVRVADPLRVELFFGLGAFVAAASAVLLARMLADREFGLAPAPEAAPGDETTLPSTVFAETR
jgi:CHASE2 domain-containing sensor protein